MQFQRRATQYNQQYNQQYPPYRYGVGRKTYQPPNVRGQFQPEQQQPRYQTHAKVDNSNNDGSQFPANLQAGWNQQNAAPRAYSDSRYNHYGERFVIFPESCLGKVGKHTTSVFPVDYLSPKDEHFCRAASSSGRVAQRWSSVLLRMGNLLCFPVNGSFS